jgi:hypothetical protein
MSDNDLLIVLDLAMGHAGTSEKTTIRDCYHRHRLGIALTRSSIRLSVSACFRGSKTEVMWDAA